MGTVMIWTRLGGMYRTTALGGFVGTIFTQPEGFVWHTFLYGRIRSSGDSPTLTAAKAAVRREQP
jgi:hypothetical protein